MSTEIEPHILKRFEIKKRIGKGAYGIVWKAVNRKTKEVVALKKIFDAFRNQTDAQRTFREIAFLQDFGEHPNIISLYNVIRAISDKDIYLVFEYMETDLHNVIKKGNILKDVHKQYILYQLLKATAYLHSAEVIHRDQKPSNVLLDSDCFVKLCDFGLARSLTGRENPQNPHSNNKNNPKIDIPALTEYVATRWYRAPEILLACHDYTKGVDMWSLGCILGEMLTGSPLFPGSSTLDQIERIMSGIPKPSREDLASVKSPYSPSILEKARLRHRRPLDQILPKTDKMALDLIYRMLHFNPHKRITAMQALKHPYIKRFYCPEEVILMSHHVVPPLDDNVQLTVSEYRNRLYQMIMSKKLNLRARKRRDTLSSPADYSHAQPDTEATNPTSEKPIEQSNPAKVHAKSDIPTRTMVGQPKNLNGRTTTPSMDNDPAKHRSNNPTPQQYYSPMMSMSNGHGHQQPTDPKAKTTTTNSASGYTNNDYSRQNLNGSANKNRTSNQEIIAMDYRTRTNRSTTPGTSDYPDLASQNPKYHGTDQNHLLKDPNESLMTAPLNQTLPKRPVEKSHRITPVPCSNMYNSNYNMTNNTNATTKVNGNLSDIPNQPTDEAGVKQLMHPSRTPVNDANDLIVSNGHMTKNSTKSRISTADYYFTAQPPSQNEWSNQPSKGQIRSRMQTPAPDSTAQESFFHGIVNKPNEPGESTTNNGHSNDAEPGTNGKANGKEQLIDSESKSLEFSPINSRSKLHSNDNTKFLHNPPAAASELLEDRGTTYSFDLGHSNPQSRMTIPSNSNLLRASVASGEFGHGLLIRDDWVPSPKPRRLVQSNLDGLTESRTDFDGSNKWSSDLIGQNRASDQRNLVNKFGREWNKSLEPFNWNTLARQHEFDSSYKDHSLSMENTHFKSDQMNLFHDLKSNNFKRTDTQHDLTRSNDHFDFMERNGAQSTTSNQNNNTPASSISHSHHNNNHHQNQHNGQFQNHHGSMIKPIKECRSHIQSEWPGLEPELQDRRLVSAPLTTTVSTLHNPTHMRQVYSTTPGTQNLGDSSNHFPFHTQTPSPVPAANGLAHHHHHLIHNHQTPLIRLNPPSSLGQFLHDYHTRAKTAMRTGVSNRTNPTDSRSLYSLKSSASFVNNNGNGNTSLPTPTPPPPPSCKSVADLGRPMNSGVQVTLKSALDLLMDRDEFGMSNTMQALNSSHKTLFKSPSSSSSSKVIPQLNHPKINPSNNLQHILRPAKPNDDYLSMKQRYPTNFMSAQSKPPRASSKSALASTFGSPSFRAYPLNRNQQIGAQNLIRTRPREPYRTLPNAIRLNEGYS